ncbi:MAG: creatininase family protein [Chloroflexota bacterium]
MNEVRWERMFPDQLEAAFARCPVVYFTYGLCEPHGPQNTVGLDALKAHAIACETARHFGGIVAPPDYWHIHELGGYALWGEKNVGEVKRKWMTAVPPWIHFKNICYHVRTADVLGFHAAIFLTGHYGPNWQDLKTVLDLVQPYTKTRLFGLPDFEANQPGFDGDNKSGDHAGKVETSLLWAVEPSCVDMSRIPDSIEAAEGNVPPVDAPKEGVVIATSPPYFAMGSDVLESSRTVGERMVQDEVQWISAKAQALLDAYDDSSDAPSLPTFASVEQMWAQELQPKLADFKSMSWTRGTDERVDAQSVWYENWMVPEVY